jgi:hypothetical protein
MRGHVVLDITERQMMRSYIGDIEEIQAHFDTLMSLTISQITP